MKNREHKSRRSCLSWTPLREQGVCRPVSHETKLKAMLWFKRINQWNSLNVVFTGMAQADLGCNRKKKTKFTTTKKGSEKKIQIWQKETKNSVNSSQFRFIHFTRSRRVYKRRSIKKWLPLLPTPIASC